ncbi:hypothetical protein PFAG_05538 [Plasmodium falciparum Santa Lucia]|uniref:Prolyl hydroxylase-like protein, putative n=11 Tax=Plasmodium falciparum TaxID=5833 RepID=Q8IL23_PLAF7|nr:prolyl hydroxylase-like protein, putative [Plasmodium falciparum 3D7]ETW29086.1 hypothetical protein PFFCH_03507 [Plasmodium falciparum FCH/4]ETW33871.1 hypothetical protein PFTANZ_05427 [Plasmodium falciparum Tanzania (2000708)]ETW39817.1 hypothetical protein PFNF135_05845 [Plasmodium falciparum NF135/5.C10]ETW46639.1 hypothetical protein PFMALIP_05277 [Plasmodium falciparum MaliPS096_E11]ETW54104.1 hypothetical protein PFUGPA_03975 [Plasmodium falciparum Palo Alto/Uganda]ETW58410.1 hypot|eukprot:XP_001348601.1 conserved Plasmodium protein, unknown function [Plasmodium falciparum 3D7]
MDIVWDKDTVDKFYNYLYDVINYEKCVELERNIRIETGTEDKLNLKNCLCYNNENCSEECNKINISSYKFKKDEDDILGEIIDNEKEKENIECNIGLITQRVFSIYTNVIKKAKLEGTYNINLETDNFIRRDIFRLVFHKYILQNTRNKIKQIQCKDTKNIISLANPLHIKDVELNKINSDTIANLMNNYIGIQKNFLGKQYMNLIYNELIFIEYNNQFNEFNTEYKNIRTDLFCWAYITSLDREKQKGLYKLLKELSYLPYELNKKANLSLQLSTLFQFLYFSPNHSFLKNHSDGGYDNLDNGKKITCIYIPSEYEHNQVLIKLYKNINTIQNNQSRNDTKIKNINDNISSNLENNKPIQVIKAEGDSLILLQTRNVSYEISMSKEKFFMVNLWIPGPVSVDKHM